VPARVSVDDPSQKFSTVSPATFPTHGQNIQAGPGHARPGKGEEGHRRRTGCRARIWTPCTRRLCACEFSESAPTPCQVLRKAAGLRSGNAGPSHTRIWRPCDETRMPGRDHRSQCQVESVPETPRLCRYCLVEVHAFCGPSNRAGPIMWYRPYHFLQARLSS